jgi:hypothetical protein
MIAIPKSACWSLPVFFSGVLLFAVARAPAGLINPNELPSVSMQVVGASEPWSYSPGVGAYIAAPNGGYQLRQPYEASGVCNGTANVRIDSLQFDPDPFVLNSILVTNTTSSTQIFSAFVGLPTSFGAPNFISGNITTSIIEGGANSATIASVSPTALYQAQIDGTTVATMQNHPFSLTTSTSTALSDAFAPTLNAVPVTSNIGIQLRFSLSAGDTAAILSRFDVTAIPEPTSAACIGGMILPVTFARRRRCAR